MVFSKKWLIVSAVAVVIVVGTVSAWLLTPAPVVAPPAKQKAAAPIEEVTHFTAAGDFGVGGEAKDVFAAMAQRKADFSVLLGDLSYGRSSESDWCALAKKPFSPAYPHLLVPGNHDLERGDVPYKRFEDCLPPNGMKIQGAYGRQYYVDAGSVRMVVIAPDLRINDHDYRYQKGDPDYDWLQASLTPDDSSGITWLIVAMHKNCITIGQKQCEISEDLFNMLVASKVDLVIQGHEHSYMRSKPLRHNKACMRIMPGSFDPECVAGSDDAPVVKGSGTILAIVGTGGIEQRDVNTGVPEVGYFAKWYGRNSNMVYGFLDVQADESTLTAQFIDTDRGTRDSFRYQVSP